MQIMHDDDKKSRVKISVLHTGNAIMKRLIPRRPVLRDY